MLSGGVAAPCPLPACLFGFSCKGCLSLCLHCVSTAKADFLLQLLAAVLLHTVLCWLAGVQEVITTVQQACCCAVDAVAGQRLRAGHT
jgi:hypothetical protein